MQIVDWATCCGDYPTANLEKVATDIGLSTLATLRQSCSCGGDGAERENIFSAP